MKIDQVLKGGRSLMITRPFFIKEQSFWMGGSTSKSGKHFVFTNLLRKAFNKSFLRNYYK
jgi:hypothetical protein